MWESLEFKTLLRPTCALNLRKICPAHAPDMQILTLSCLSITCLFLYSHSLIVTHTLSFSNFHLFSEKRCSVGGTCWQGKAFFAHIPKTLGSRTYVRYQPILTSHLSLSTFCLLGMSPYISLAIVPGGCYRHRLKYGQNKNVRPYRIYKILYAGSWAAQKKKRA